MARRSELEGEDAAAIMLVAFFITCIAAFVRHLWWIISICMGSAPIHGGHIVIAIFGVLFPPFGVLHGFWLWFN